MAERVADLGPECPCESYPCDYAVSAHADAAARLLLEVARELRLGRAPEELGERVILLGRVMARTI